MLHELGMPSHIKGYQYIREGITLVYKNPEIIGGYILDVDGKRLDASIIRQLSKLYKYAGH